MMILYFIIVLHVFIVCLAYRYIAWHIPPRIPSLNIITISLSVNSSNSTPAFFKHACHANPGADKK